MLYLFDLSQSKRDFNLNNLLKGAMAFKYKYWFFLYAVNFIHFLITPEAKNN